MKWNFRVCNILILIILSIVVVGCQSAEPVTIESLLKEMVDRDQLARLDEPAYTCGQFSSYDRRSTSPDADGWFANRDWDNYVRTEQRDGRTEHVMMDSKGPGAIVRVWLTMSGSGSGRGTLRIYLDGEDTPAIEGNVFDVVSRGMLADAPLSQGVSPLTEELQQGHNLYFPIPYADSCKVTFEKVGEGSFYYLINYRTYEPGTQVETFSFQAKQRAENEIASVLEKLASSDRGSTESWKTEALSGNLAPGKSKSITVSGPAAIRRILLNIDADDLDQALRSTVLKIEFDGNQTVWAPVGDFFGTGHQLHPYQSWYTEVAQDGTLGCWWVMPYQQQAKVTVLNLGQQMVDIKTAQVSAGAWDWDHRSLYFHSTWKELYNARTLGATGEDVNFVTVTGQGKYVGDTLTIFNGGWDWWGEGDEKIYVDGEDFPSHFGTGTEDYYGYAWCRPERFVAPFHAQPCGDGNLEPGFAVNSRWRALDAIPFNESIRMDMELWHWQETKVNYAPTTFWYARPGAVSNISPAPEEVTRPVAREREDIVEISRVEGAIEGESLEVLDVSAGFTQIQGLGDRWSDDRQLWWLGADTGSKLVLNLPCDHAGRYTINAGLTYARDYGIVTIRLNGKVLKEDLNLYNPELQWKEITLGDAELNQGNNRLEIEITGADPDAIKEYMFGLDYVRLTDFSGS